MLVIRRRVEQGQGYTVFMLPDYYKEFPTTEREHSEILKIFKQDRPHPDVINDFVDYKIGAKYDKPDTNKGLLSFR